MLVGSHPFVIASLLIFAVCFPTFLWVQSWVTRPIMPVKLIRHAPRANLLASNFLAAILANAFFFNMYVIPHYSLICHSTAIPFLLSPRSHTEHAPIIHDHPYLTWMLFTAPSSTRPSS
jgi:hypothetical protein